MDLIQAVNVPLGVDMMLGKLTKPNLFICYTGQQTKVLFQSLK